MYWFKLKMTEAVTAEIQSEKGQKVPSKIRLVELEKERDNYIQELAPFLDIVERELGNMYVKFINDYFFDNKSIAYIDGTYKYKPLKGDNMRHEIRKLALSYYYDRNKK